MSGALLRRRSIMQQRGVTFDEVVLALSDLIGYWKFDDLMTEVTGNLPDGSYLNGPPLGPSLLSDDPDGISRDFEDSLGQQAESGGVVDLTPTAIPGWTFGCLVNPESGGSSVDTSILFSVTTASGPGNGIFAGFEAATMKPEVGGWGAAYIAPDVVPTGSVSFLVYTMDNTAGAVHVYINGVESGTGGTGNRITSGAAQPYFGNWAIPAFGEKHYDGLIANAFLVGRVITSTEMAALEAHV